MDEATLLGRRLDRLRTLTRPATAVAGPSDEIRGGDRAAGLAEALGGTLERSSEGTVVRVDRREPLPASLETLRALPYPIEPSRPIVCLDTETTGLGTATGTVPFLVGLGWWDGEDFAVRQFFLPDHADEPALLRSVAEAIPADAWLVTYNGRSFDWPLLVTRYRLRRREPPGHVGHLDLLPIARQLWRHRLVDARLASVEHGVAGVRRGPDLPGHLIPERFFSFLRTGRGGLLREVAEHNHQDVISLARLLVLLADGLARRETRSATHPGDVYGLARAFTRRGRCVEALECVDQALEALGTARWYRRLPLLEERLLIERARLLGRLGRRDEAAEGWSALAAEGGHYASLGWLQLAKHREHAARDAHGAYEAASRASVLAARARLIGRPMPWLERDLARRMPRLRRAMERRPVSAALLPGGALPGGP